MTRTVPVRLDAHRAGSMRDRIDPAQSPGMRMLRNTIQNAGRWDTRPTWEKINAAPMGWDWAIGMHEYHDTQGTRHVIVVGDDGNIYHDVNWAVPVVMHDPVSWDGTYQATFAEWNDDLFIALGAETGSNCNLRYDGMLGEVFGVGLDAPVATQVLADGGPGTLPAGTYRYIVTFLHVPAVGGRTESPPSNPSGELVILADRRINITGIPISAAPGRTIWRRIWRSVDGEPYVLVETIEDNVTVVLEDNDITEGATLQTYYNVPVCEKVAVNADGLVIWFNDRNNDQPATYYVALDFDHPEVWGAEDVAGQQSDPITAPYQVRDGIFVGKRRSVQWLSRQCETCEGLLHDIGCVAWATVQNFGSEVAWLSERGPVVTDHNFHSDFRFCGEERSHFCLAETWENVVKTRLPFASSFHSARHGIIGWWVQMCPQQAGVRDFNDTIIWWDYGCRSAEFPGGRVGIWDMIGCYACTVTDDDTGEDEVWATYPFGFLGKMLTGAAGDGVTELIYGNLVINQEGTTVWVDDAEWSPVFEAWTGTSLHIYNGTGSRSCRDALPCDRPNTLITSHFNGTLELATEVQLDTTSEVWVGGFKWVPDLDGLDFDVPTAVKNLVFLDVQLKGR